MEKVIEAIVVKLNKRGNIYSFKNVHDFQLFRILFLWVPYTFNDEILNKLVDELLKIFTVSVEITEVK